MELSELKIGDLFVVASAKGKKNAQTFKVKSMPYYNQYFGGNVVSVSNIKKGTQGIKAANLQVIQIQNWLSPFG